MGKFVNLFRIVRSFRTCRSENNQLGPQILKNETGVVCFEKHDLT